MHLHCVIFLSSHVHVLATHDDPEVMAGFHCHLTTNLSKEVRRSYGWNETVFPNRYSAVELSEEPEVEIARLRYILSNGVKEGLVASPLDWPGVTAAASLISGEPLKGTWIDRTAFWEAKNRGETVTLDDFTFEREVHFEPLPSLAHLSPEDGRKLVQGMILEIEEEGRAMHRRHGTRPLGVAKILAEDPEFRPKEVEKRPCPWFHVLDPQLRDALYAALVLVMVEYRSAVARLKTGHFEGDPKNLFPHQTFAPTLGFVRKVEILEPG